MGAGAGSVKEVLGLAGLSWQPSVPGLSSLTPSEQKRGALSNARHLWPDGWPQGTHPGAQFVVVVFRENWCALFWMCLALKFDVTHADERADITVTSVGFTRVQ